MIGDETFGALKVGGYQVELIPTLRPQLIRLIDTELSMSLLWFLPPN